MSDSNHLNIWITGCSGFLGSRLARHFSTLGHRTVGLSRRECPQVDHSAPIDLAAPATPKKLQELVSRFGQTDVVIHAAARQPGSGVLADFINANVQSTLHLLEALQEYPPKQIIYTSTLSVYQRPGALPVKESSPAGGSLPYSATKCWAEQLLETFHQRSQVVILRAPSLYGAGQAESFVDGLARTALKGERIELFAQGELIRDALHVSDVVKAIDACVARPPRDPFTLINLGCGRAIETAEYARELVAALGSGSEIIPIKREAAHFDLYADITLARRQLGFEPMTLSESMRVYADEIRT